MEEATRTETSQPQYVLEEKAFKSRTVLVFGQINDSLAVILSSD